MQNCRCDAAGPEFLSYHLSYIKIPNKNKMKQSIKILKTRNEFLIYRVRECFIYKPKPHFRQLITAALIT
jgi:hypothetical protein